MEAGRELEVEKIMEAMPDSYISRWCESDRCACLGCVNNAGKQFGEITKDEWLAWKKRQLSLALGRQGIKP